MAKVTIILDGSGRPVSTVIKLHAARIIGGQSFSIVRRIEPTGEIITPGAVRLGNLHKANDTVRIAFDNLGWQLKL